MAHPVNQSASSTGAPSPAACALPLARQPGAANHGRPVAPIASRPSGRSALRLLHHSHGTVCEREPALAARRGIVHRPQAQGNWRHTLLHRIAAHRFRHAAAGGSRHPVAAGEQGGRGDLQLRGLQRRRPSGATKVGLVAAGSGALTSPRGGAPERSSAPGRVRCSPPHPPPRSSSRGQEAAPHSPCRFRRSYGMLRPARAQSFTTIPQPSAGHVHP